MTDNERQVLMNIRSHLDLAKQQLAAAAQQLLRAEEKLARLLTPPEPQK